MRVTINRQKLGVEDLSLGIGTETQIRGGVEVEVTKLNTAILPYNEQQTLGEVLVDMEAHLGNADNPHQVTKDQLGLGNVNNTSDASKPISIAQQEALDDKVNSLASGANIEHIYRQPNWVWNTNGSVTGVLLIEITDLYEETLSGMMKVMITQNGAADALYPDYDLLIGGAWRAIDHSWHNTKASVETLDSAPLSIRFAHSATQVYIAIGDTNTVWSYPRVVIREVISNDAGIYAPSFAISSSLSYPSTIDSLWSISGSPSKMSIADYLGAIGNLNSPLLDLSLKNSLAMKSGVGSVTFTRASTATYIDRYSVLKTAAIDEPRFEKEGYLNEGSSTNLVTYSEQFDNVVWVKSGCTISANSGTDPYGTAFADKMVESATTAVHQMSQSFSTVSGTVYTYSVFVDPVERSTLQIVPNAISFPSTYANFDLSSGTVSGIGANITAGIQKVGQYYRCWVTVTATSTASSGFYIVMASSPTMARFASYAGDGTSGFYVFGAQLEALSFASSYIPTVASTVTRASDILNVTRAGNIPDLQDNPLGLTVAYDINSLGQNPSTSQYTWSTYLSSTNTLGSSIFGTAGIRQTLINSSGSAINSYLTTNFKNRRVIAIASNSLLNLYVDGTIMDTDTNTTGRLTDTANSLANIRIGGLGVTTSSNFYGHISNFRIYDRTLTTPEAAIA